MQRFFIFVLLAFILMQCKFQNRSSENNIDAELKPKTEEEILAEKKAREDSIKNAEFELMQKTAFGKLTFGMDKTDAETSTENTQLLGKHNYKVQNSFNANSELYEVALISENEKAVHFDDLLKSKYTNLYKIIETKYGKPMKKGVYPSIFEVQESGSYIIDKWELGDKQIQLGVKENSLNSYCAFSKIFSKKMADEEKLRLRNNKNKDIIEAAEKF